jgi:hypothetical protein
VPKSEPLSTIDSQLVKSKPDCLSVELWQPGNWQFEAKIGSTSCEKLTFSLGETGLSELHPMKFIEFNTRSPSKSDRKKAIFLLKFGKIKQ